MIDEVFEGAIVVEGSHDHNVGPLGEHLDVDVEDRVHVGVLQVEKDLLQARPHLARRVPQGTRIGKCRHRQQPLCAGGTVPDHEPVPIHAAP